MTEKLSSSLLLNLGSQGFLPLDIKTGKVVILKTD